MKRLTKPLCVILTAISLLPQFAAAAPARETVEDKRVDLAIAKALRFLATQQLASGAWKIEAYGESTAATSLAIMAYLAAGHVPGEGPYSDSIQRGVQYVLAHQLQNGMILHNTSHGPFYCHGISTLMLAEVVGMVPEPLATECRKALEKAVALILKAQAVAKTEQHAGGWRYQMTSQDSDLSVTGWQLMALRAAKNVGCDVPAESIERAVAYVKRCSSRWDGGFGYQPKGSPTPTRTGTAILALEVCGEHASKEAMKGADYLLENTLESTDNYFFYGAYYCSMGMFKIGGKHWDALRGDLHERLLDMQEADGSWLARHGTENSAGNIYCTSMSVLALAVEYQYLPIYQR